MNIQKYIEVRHDLEPIVLPLCGDQVSKLINLFDQKARNGTKLPSKYISDIEINGKTYKAYEFSVGIMEYVILAYCIERTDNNNILIHARRFEKANVMGKAVWNIASNIFSGNRTFGKELALLSHTAKLVAGAVETSPLAKDARVSADIKFDVMNQYLQEAILQFAIEM